MELLGSSASPFVRKVRIVAAEGGIDDRVAFRPLTSSPVDPNASLTEANPLAKMPTMKTHEGVTIYDSRVICEYLDSMSDGAIIFPEPLEGRWGALQEQALGDGMLDSAVSIRYERNIRPLEKRWATWLEGQFGKLRRGLDWAESQADRLNDRVDIGVITLACVGGYLDFRFPEEKWREGRTSLATWYEEFSRRDSMITTAHE